jgi:3-oxoacyl-[acyl-carrier-protein] synthase II
MLQALTMAGLPREAVGLINAHGTGTVLNDAAEAAACRACFGSDQPPITSTKPVTGHAFGATAAIEALLTIQSLRHQIAPPIATCTHPDPALGLNLILGSPRPLATEYALSISLGFWGNLAALLFQRCPASPESRSILNSSL